jgi:DNA-binding MarR family transcriptional regulator
MQTETLQRLFAVGMVLGPSLSEGLADYGLSEARAELLWRLRDHGPMNQRRLSELLQCTARNVTGLVDALETAHLVKRAPHPGDRRATLVTLTEEGQDLVETWDQHAQALAARLFDGIPRDDLGRLASTLEMILDRLG